MLKNAGLLALGVMFAGSAVAAENKLFKDFAYDAPKASFAKTKGIYDCSADIGGDALCIDDVDFIGHKFVQVLAFTGAKLKAVSLVSMPYEQEVYTSSVAALTKSFQLVAMANKQAQLDLIELAKKSKDKNDYVTKLTNFENQSLQAGNLTYTLFEGVEMKSSYTSAAVMGIDMPETVRAAELAITEEADDSALVIRFSFPKLDQKQFAEAAKKPVESF